MRQSGGRWSRAKLCNWFGAVLLFSAAGSLAAQTVTQSDAERVGYAVKPAVVLVWMSIEGVIAESKYTPAIPIQRGSSGSGWIISPDGYVVTNGHVVDVYQMADADFRRTLVAAEFARRGLLADWSEDGRSRLIEQVARNSRFERELQVYLQNGQRFTAEVKEYSPSISILPGKTSAATASSESGKDVAVLKIEARDLPTVRLGDSDEVQLNQPIRVVGFPGAVLQHPFLHPQSALQASFTAGEISSHKVAVQGASVLQMDAKITYGNSGGPVINARGQVIGMATFGTLDSSGDDLIQGLSFAVPVNTVREFIRAAGVDLERSGLFDQTWSSALSAYYRCDWTSAISGFEHALRLIPGLPDAEQLRREAIAGYQTGARPEWCPPNPIPPTFWQRVSDWIADGPGAYLAAAGVLALFALAGLVMARRRPPVASPAVPADRAAPAAGRAGDHPPEDVGLVAGAAARPRPLGCLTVRDGPERGRSIPLSSEGVRIGRDPRACQLVLTDPSVSREHAVVRLNGPAGDIVIRRLSQTNPLEVNDRVVTETVLHGGDRIKIGNSVLEFEAAAVPSA